MPHYARSFLSAMCMLLGLIATLLFVFFLAYTAPLSAEQNDSSAYPQPKLFPGEERHLKNIRQLTFGGQNAEAYFSFAGDKLILQSTHGSYPADRIFVMNIDGSGVRQISPGKGVTTCGYFLLGDEDVIYSSTHEYMESPPPPLDYSKGYIWKLHPEYEIYRQKLDGGEPVNITNSWGYDAEATVNPVTGEIIFTSDRTGDLELWLMNPDGSNLRQLTHTAGYDGGAFFNVDGTKIVWRANRPKTKEDLDEYFQLLREEHVIKPMNLEIYIMNADGSGRVKLTNNGAANFAPFFTPDGKKVIFASNMNDSKGRNFELYLVDIETKEIEQVTFGGEFESFPMFSPDGKKLVWASNRNGITPRETNIFIADWVE